MPQGAETPALDPDRRDAVRAELLTPTPAQVDAVEAVEPPIGVHLEEAVRIALKQIDIPGEFAAEFRVVGAVNCVRGEKPDLKSDPAVGRQFAPEGRLILDRMAGDDGEHDQSGSCSNAAHRSP